MALQGVTMAHLVRLCRVCLTFLLVAFTCQVRIPRASVEAERYRLHLSSPCWMWGWRR